MRIPKALLLLVFILLSPSLSFAFTLTLEPRDFMDINLNDPFTPNDMSPHPSYSTNWLGILVETPEKCVLSIPSGEAVTGIREPIPICLYISLPSSMLGILTDEDGNTPDELDLEDKAIPMEICLKDVDSGRIITTAIPEKNVRKIINELNYSDEFIVKGNAEEIKAGFVTLNMSSLTAIPAKNTTYLVWIRIGTIESNRTIMRTELNF